MTEPTREEARDLIRETRDAPYCDHGVSTGPMAYCERCHIAELEAEVEGLKGELSGYLLTEELLDSAKRCIEEQESQLSTGPKDAALTEALDLLREFVERWGCENPSPGIQTVDGYPPDEEPCGECLHCRARALLEEHDVS